MVTSSWCFSAAVWTGLSKTLLALDADPAAIRRVAERLAGPLAEQRLILVQASFDQLASIVSEQRFAPVDGVLLDLGVSSFQLETPERGFA
mgnify:CR=1 FL=1